MRRREELADGLRDAAVLVGLREELADGLRDAAVLVGPLPILETLTTQLEEAARTLREELADGLRDAAVLVGPLPILETLATQLEAAVGVLEASAQGGGGGPDGAQEGGETDGGAVVAGKVRAEWGGTARLLALVSQAAAAAVSLAALGGKLASLAWRTVETAAWATAAAVSLSSHGGKLSSLAWRTVETAAWVMGGFAGCLAEAGAQAAWRACAGEVAGAAAGARHYGAARGGAVALMKLAERCAGEMVLAGGLDAPLAVLVGGGPAAPPTVTLRHGQEAASVILLRGVGVMVRHAGPEAADRLLAAVLARAGAAIAPLLHRTATGGAFLPPVGWLPAAVLKSADRKGRALAGRSEEVGDVVLREVAQAAGELQGCGVVLDAARETHAVEGGAASPCCSTALLAG
ncbi:hypothetical protein T484DRAFT_1773963 [Baffinella frigidus]|nr:hypothetical protein T484DRAFT_1773963 [Cryptophyta sp. CCMP2293]